MGGVPGKTTHPRDRPGMRRQKIFLIALGGRENLTLSGRLFLEKHAGFQVLRIFRAKLKRFLVSLDDAFTAWAAVIPHAIESQKFL
jgi:hypothetical protein